MGSLRRAIKKVFWVGKGRGEKWKKIIEDYRNKDSISQKGMGKKSGKPETLTLPKRSRERKKKEKRHKKLLLDRNGSLRGRKGKSGKRKT